MSETTLIQIFILLDVFIIGIAVAFAWTHGMSHFRPKNNTDQENQIGLDYKLSAEMKERLVKQSEARYEDILKSYSHDLQQTLYETTNQTNNLVKQLATGVVTGELERYRKDLEKLHEQVDKDFGSIKHQVDDFSGDVKKKMAEELQQEKEQLIKQIDTKLADAVASFLVEAMQHNIDLGNQESYLRDLLERHKPDLIAEVKNDD